MQCLVCTCKLCCPPHIGRALTYGVGSLQVDHPAVEVVQARLRDGSSPGKRKDSYKVGLVVEGGGMRGVVTGAALQAMHDLGMRQGSKPLSRSLHSEPPRHA